jgi:hypothetical protein
MPKSTKLERGLPEPHKWPNMNEEIAVRKLKPGNKATELRNL